ncbi:MAG: hypothetical protein ACW98F_17845 [Candidatus Hodarchaeales archaeon]|jgi:hypothetical protein
MFKQLFFIIVIIYLPVTTQSSMVNASFYGEMPIALKLLAGPDESLSLFYLKEFSGGDYIYQDWIRITGNNYVFNKPIRVKKAMDFPVSAISLLEVTSFEDKAYIFYHAHAEYFGIYGQTWNFDTEKWSSALPLLRDPDFEPYLGIRFNRSEERPVDMTYYFIDYFPGHFDSSNNFHCVIYHDVRNEKGRLPYSLFYVRSNLSTSEIIDFSPLPFNSSLSYPYRPVLNRGFIVGNTTNIVIKVDNLNDESLFLYSSGSGQFRWRNTPINGGKWRKHDNGDIYYGNLTKMNNTFVLYKLLDNDWALTEYSIPSHWTTLVDWEYRTGNLIHLLGLTKSDKMEYGVLNGTELYYRELHLFNSTSLVDLVVHPNGNPFIGGITTNGNLTTCQLSLDEELSWFYVQDWLVPTYRTISFSPVVMSIISLIMVCIFFRPKTRK